MQKQSVCIKQNRSVGFVAFWKNAIEVAWIKLVIEGYKDYFESIWMDLAVFQ